MTTLVLLRILAAVLAGAIALTLAVIDGHWQPPPPQPPVLPAVAQGAMAASAIRADQLAEIAARPLFLATRRPLEVTVAAEPEAEPAQEPLDGTTLVGIYNSGGTLGVLLATGQEVARLRFGDTWQGWRLLSVGVDSVELVAADGTRTTLELERRPQLGGMTATPARAPAARGKTQPGGGAAAGNPRGSREATPRAARNPASGANSSK